jgi:hypothetical protein
MVTHSGAGAGHDGAIILDGTNTPGFMSGGNNVHIANTLVPAGRHPPRGTTLSVGWPGMRE